MSTVTPGWYKDPADPTTQRYWDGEGWLGDPLPADAQPPPGPPPEQRPASAAPAETGQMAAASSQATDASSQATDASSRADGAHTGPSAPAGGVASGQGGAPVTPLSWPPGYPHPYPGTAPPLLAHGLALAGGGRRLGARVVDFFAVLVLCVIANAWFAYHWWQAIVPFWGEVNEYQLNGGPAPEAPEAISNLFVMMCVVATAVWFAYEVPSSANSGQTLGKRLMGIKVVRVESGERLGFGRSFRRWGRLGLPTLLWPCFGVGLLLQFLDCLFVAIDRPLHQALHDKAAATVVVRVPRSGSTDMSQLSDAAHGGRRADQS